MPCVPHLVLVGLVGPADDARQLDRLRVAGDVQLPAARQLAAPPQRQTGQTQTRV